MLSLTPGDVALAWPLAIAMLFAAVAAAGLRRSPAALAALAVAGAAAYHRQALPGFALVCTASYVLARGLAAAGFVRIRWRMATVAMLALFGLFLVGRWDRWDVSEGGLVWFWIDMWLVLRLVTLMWEIGSGAIPLPSPGRFITWVCLPLTIAGPLLRYSEFQHADNWSTDWWRSRSWWDGLAAATAKFAAGIALGAAHQGLLQRQGEWPAGLLAVLVTGPLGFYLVYAGYFHLMQVLAIPAGFALPDSFRWPIGRPNISQFWGTWNMTATRVFRDYLFYNRWGGSRHHVYLNVMILFALVGLWHASNLYWLLWGLLHGTLFCGYLAWRRYNTRLGFMPLRGTRLARFAAAALTYACVCACWYLPSKLLARPW